MSKTAVQPVHITGIFPELMGVGGVQESGRLTALALDEIARRRGWTADFASLNDPAGAQALRFDEKELPFQGYARAKIRFALGAAGRARAAAKAPTHIIFAGHPNLAPIALWMQKTSARARAIVVAHGVEVWEPLPAFRRATIRHAFLVAAPSGFTIQNLIQVQGVSPNRTRRLAWPLSPTFLRLADRPADLHAPAALPEGDIVLTVGRAAASERYKGADSLIRAMARISGEFPNLRLVSVGGGDDLPRLQALANELGVAGQVHFLQGLSRPELAACYSRAQIFALPSSGEGFGLVFLEAMAFGKPVVAAAAGGALDVVRDEVNGLLVQPQAVGSLADALRRLLVDQGLRERLGKRGATMVRQAHQFEAFRGELESLLDECTMDSRLR